MRFPVRSFKILLALASFSLLGLLTITGFLKPQNSSKSQEPNWENSQEGLRLPLIISEENQNQNFDSQVVVDKNPVEVNPVEQNHQNTNQKATLNVSLNESPNQQPLIVASTETITNETKSLSNEKVPKLFVKTEEKKKSGEIFFKTDKKNKKRSTTPMPSPAPVKEDPSDKSATSRYLNAGL